MKVTVISERCPQNHYCPVIRVCPNNAIEQTSPYSAPNINSSNCTDCGLCTNYCAYGAIKMT
ncbi:MAG: 4Fe-4S ferredoxin [Chlorobi bacterium]|nr:4Fe-4S ferredoxin [Chlorobiota bacterium]